MVDSGKRARNAPPNAATSATARAMPAEMATIRPTPAMDQTGDPGDHHERTPLSVAGVWQPSLVHGPGLLQGDLRSPGRGCSPPGPHRAGLAVAMSTSISLCPFARSSWPVGSSARMRRGRCASTRARHAATRCAWPPESSSGSFSARSSTPTARSASLPLWLGRRGKRRLASTSGNTVFSATVRAGTRLSA